MKWLWNHGSALAFEPDDLSLSLATFEIGTLNF